MNAIEAIKTRRSVRSFKPEPVPSDVMEQILDAAYSSPNTGNRQQAQVVICDDAAINEWQGRTHCAIIRQFNATDEKGPVDTSDEVIATFPDAFHGAPTVTRGTQTAIASRRHGSLRYPSSRMQKMAITTTLS